jgi:hypothetical protein
MPWRSTASIVAGGRVGLWAEAWAVLALNPQAVNKENAKGLTGEGQASSR